jgi:hypothetical protein
MIKKLTAEDDRIRHKVEASKIKAGDLMAFVYYGQIKDAKPNVLQVKSLGGSDMDFQVQGTELIENGFSADQFAEEVKVTKTKAAEILISSHNRPLTVCFEKTDGSERIMRGRLVTPEPLLGRSMVEDLDITDGHRLRLVDHRTIRYLVVEGVKYVVK